MGEFGKRREGRLTGPITVALVNDYELVLRGLVTMLAPFRSQIEVIEVDVDRDPVSKVDVALFDTYGHVRLGIDRIAALAHCGNVGAVAVYTNYAAPEHSEAALSAGARAVLSKSMPAEQLADALFAVADGSQVVSDNFGGDGGPPWPGHDFGLTSRESEVAALLGQAMSNKDIARALWISENTVKTHLKAIFQKTTATSRSQAIVRIAGDAGFVRRRIA